MSVRAVIYRSGVICASEWFSTQEAAVAWATAYTLANEGTSWDIE